MRRRDVQAMATRVRVPGTARPCCRKSHGRRAAPAGTVMPQPDAPPARPARAAHGFAVMARQAAIGDRRRMGLQGRPGPRIDRPMPDSAATWWRAWVLRSPARLSFPTMLSIDDIAGTAEDRPSTAADHMKQRCKSRCRPHAPCLGNLMVARETSCRIIGVWAAGAASLEAVASGAAISARGADAGTAAGAQWVRRREARLAGAPPAPAPAAVRGHPACRRRRCR